MNSNYIHPVDQKIMDSIFENSTVQKWMDKLYGEGLDETCQYVYAVSCKEITTPWMLDALQKACCHFNVPVEHVRLYVSRTYDYNVVLMGCEQIAVLIPEGLLEKDDKEIIVGRIGAAVGEIAAGHAPLSFLTWMVENMFGSLKIPFVTEAFIALINEWKRVRVYTADRAFLQITGKLPVSLRNILYGEIPMQAMENMNIGTEKDQFMNQVKEYQMQESIVGKAGKLLSVFQDHIWLPTRYQELLKYASECEEVD